jgi:hypothetical protein
MHKFGSSARPGFPALDRSAFAVWRSTLRLATETVEVKECSMCVWRVLYVFDAIKTLIIETTKPFSFWTHCFPVVIYNYKGFFLVRNGENVPNDHTLYQVAIKYTKWP